MVHTRYTMEKMRRKEIKTHWRQKWNCWNEKKNGKWSRNDEILRQITAKLILKRQHNHIQQASNDACNTTTTFLFCSKSVQIRVQIPAPEYSHHPIFTCTRYDHIYLCLFCVFPGALHLTMVSFGAWTFARSFSSSQILVKLVPCSSCQWIVTTHSTIIADQRWMIIKLQSMIIKRSRVNYLEAYIKWMTCTHSTSLYYTWKQTTFLFASLFVESAFDSWKCDVSCRFAFFVFFFLRTARFSL